MGCGSGACSASRLGKPPCEECEDSAYRAKVNAMFNPWRNAGDTIPNPYDYGLGSAEVQNVAYGTGVDKSMGGGIGTDSTGAIAGTISGAIEQGAGIARTVIGADLERERLRTARDIAQINADAARYSGGGYQSTSPRLESSSSGGTSMLLLVGLGIGAAILSGAVKVGRR
jgi:hypothetical protein